MKSLEKINELPDSSTEIQSDNLLKRYQRRPGQLSDHCLADFAAWYDIQSSKSNSGFQFPNESDDWWLEACQENKIKSYQVSTVSQRKGP